MIIPRPKRKIAQNHDINLVMASVRAFAESKGLYVIGCYERAMTGLVSRGYTVFDVFKSCAPLMRPEFAGGVWVVKSRFLFWTTYKAFFHSTRKEYMK